MTALEVQVLLVDPEHMSIQTVKRDIIEIYTMMTGGSTGSAKETHWKASSPR